MVRRSRGGSTCNELPTPTPAVTFPRVEPGQLRIDVKQLRAIASQWREPCTELNAVAPPLPGQPFQPTTAAVGGVNASVDLAAAALTARIQTTTSAVDAGVADYLNNEATAATEMATVPHLRLV